MTHLIRLATPHGPATTLNIECHQEPGRHGDHILTAYRDHQPVHTARYSWNVWYGHCCGQLLMPAFVAEAEKRAKDAGDA